MHELGLAQTLLEQVRAVAREHGNPRVARVRVRIGEYAGVEPEALRFAFEVLRDDCGLAGAALDIERVPARLRCPACGAEREVRGADGALAADRTCSGCGGMAELALGQELELAAIDVEDDGGNQGL